LFEHSIGILLNLNKLMKYDFRHDTIFMAATFLRIVWQKISEPIIPCILLAGKIEEIYPPRLTKYIEVYHNIFELPIL